LKTEVVVDKEALDQGEFRQQGGGFVRLNRVFDGRLETILAEITESIWEEVWPQMNADGHR
jgi:type I restriction enzyme R subunit